MNRHFEFLARQFERFVSEASPREFEAEKGPESPLAKSSMGRKGLSTRIIK